MMINFNKIFESRMKRVVLMIEMSTKRIVKKEFKKMKKDIERELK